MRIPLRRSQSEACALLVHDRWHERRFSADRLTFALAGGAHKVEYPAKTLYENEVKSTGSLHDVTAGSNGECTKPFSETGLSGCTTAEEATKAALPRGSVWPGRATTGPAGSGRPTGSPRSRRRRRSLHPRSLR